MSRMDSFKKLFALILALLFCFTFFACVSLPTDPPDDGPPIIDPNDDENPGDKEPEPTSSSYTPFLTQTLPIIKITTDSGSDITGSRVTKLGENTQPYFPSKISTENCDSDFVISSAPAEVRVRGNYTANYPKKPFRIKFAEKQRMLGLNGGKKYKNWVLLADYKDSSLTRNALAFYFGKNILSSDGYYTSDFRPVELYVNNKYRGVYLLAEQQQVNTTRVNISEPDDGYSGTDIGYFFEYDTSYYDLSPEMEHFIMTYNGIKQLKRKSGTMVNIGRSGRQHGYTIKSDVYDMAQTNYLREYMDKIFKVAYNAVYTDTLFEISSTSGNVVYSTEFTTARQAVESVLDVKSLVDMYLVQEICCDYDIAFSSFYMSLDMSAEGNKKLTFVAPWDFDSAIGLSFEPNGYSYIENSKALYAANCANPWLILLINEDWFWEMCVSRWKEISQLGVMTGALDLVNSYSTMYVDYYKKNFDKWPQSMGVAQENRVAKIVETFTTQADAAAYLREWLTSRINYLETVFV